MMRMSSIYTNIFICCLGRPSISEGQGFLMPIWCNYSPHWPAVLRPHSEETDKIPWTYYPRQKFVGKSAYFQAGGGVLSWTNMFWTNILVRTLKKGSSNLRVQTGLKVGEPFSCWSFYVAIKSATLAYQVYSRCKRCNYGKQAAIVRQIVTAITGRPIDIHQSIKHQATPAKSSLFAASAAWRFLSHRIHLLEKNHLACRHTIDTIYPYTRRLL